MFRRRKKAQTERKWICGRCKQQGSGPSEAHVCPSVEPDPVHKEIATIAAERAPHNPHQALILAGEAKPLTEIVAAAGDNVPALVGAMTVMAERYTQLVTNLDTLNKTLGEFKHQVVGPFQQELKYLRYTTGERLNHASNDLEVYVHKLDQVIWGALRATGMTDEQIQQYRTVNGMQPEAPRGPELEAHVDRVEALEEAVRVLTHQNQRLVAQLDTRHEFRPEEDGWVWHQGCACLQCVQQTERMGAALQEASRA